MAFGLSAPVQGQDNEDSLEGKVKDIRDAVKEKVQERLDEVQKGQKRAFVGEVSDLTNHTLILTVRQEEKQVRVSDEATIINLKRQEIDFEDIEIGSHVIAMGYLEENGILDGRRIVVTEKPTPPVQRVAFGEMTDKSTEENVLTVKHPKKETVWSVEVTSKTRVTKKEDEEMETIKFDEIEIGDHLVAIGSPDTEENFIVAKLIHVVPGLSKQSEN